MRPLVAGLGPHDCVCLQIAQFNRSSGNKAPAGIYYRNCYSPFRAMLREGARNGKHQSEQSRGDCETERKSRPLRHTHSPRRRVNSMRSIICKRSVRPRENLRQTFTDRWLDFVYFIRYSCQAKSCLEPEKLLPSP